MRNGEGEIIPLESGQTPETRQIITPSAPIDREPTTIRSHGIVIDLLPGAAIITLPPGATISTTTGALTQVIIRLNPTQPPAHSRGTDLL